MRPRQGISFHQFAFVLLTAVNLQQDEARNRKCTTSSGSDDPSRARYRYTSPPSLLPHLKVPTYLPTYLTGAPSSL
ncbi:hypothetical protein CKAH01_02463 [Colletotrichum kahawae]|uniref:Secreted protein n=1 Tax=Colletotrichum kahawae TaxID=34407 RepID=A0AAE0CYQ1_COLKA|nr:hypothetical protein CKAH01_02463 [Colletotrichum kahawae]